MKPASLKAKNKVHAGLFSCLLELISKELPEVSYNLATQKLQVHQLFFGGGEGRLGGVSGHILCGVMKQVRLYGSSFLLLSQSSVKQKKNTHTRGKMAARFF